MYILLSLNNPKCTDIIESFCTFSITVNSVFCGYIWLFGLLDTTLFTNTLIHVSGAFNDTLTFTGSSIVNPLTS